MSDWSQQSDSAATDDGTELGGQVAVVTGASRGIGRAIAVEFARAGADVVVHAGRNQDAADRVADQIRQLGRQSHVCVADLSDCNTHQRLVDDPSFGTADYDIHWLERFVETS